MKNYNTLRFSKIFLPIIAAVFAVVVFFVVGFAAAPAAAEPVESGLVLKEIEVEQNAGYIFTEGQTAESLRYVVTVTAIYSEPQSGDESEDGEASEPVDVRTERRVLEYAGAVPGNADAFVAATGEVVELTLVGNTLAVNVTAPSGGEYSGSASAEKTVTITPDNQKMQIGIYAQYIGNYAELTTMSVLENKDFAVYKFYNNGLPGGEDDRLIGDAYNVSVNLFPNTPIDFAVEDVLYDTDVEITTNNSTPEYTTTARVTGIKYKKPGSVISIDGQLKTQTAMSELDITGITVKLDYFEQYSVPLSLFPNDSYTCTYYKTQTDAASGSNGSDKMDVDTKWCVIRFTYPGGEYGTVTGRKSINVSPIAIRTPAFPTENALNFYDGVNVEITDIDYTEELGVQPNILVSVGNVVGDAFGAYDDTYYAVDRTADAIKVTFKKPGLPYVIKLSLDDSLDTSDGAKNNGNYQWSAAQTNVTRVDDVTLYYTVQVNKSVIKFTGDFTDFDASWEYGKNYAGGANVNATILNAEDTVLEFIYDATGSLKDTTAGDVTYGYYHLEFIDGATGERTTVMPKKAGRYEAVVVTHETDIWKSSDAYDPNMTDPFIVTVYVTPVVIDPDNMLITDPTYDRTEYGKDDIIKPEVTSKFVDDDGSARSVLPFSATFAIAAGAVSAPIKYADSYTVNFTLTDDNFVFATDGNVPSGYYDAATKPGRTATNTFTINKLEIVPTIDKANGWTYGDAATVAANFSASLPSKYAPYANLAAAEFYDAANTAIAAANLNKLNEWAAGDYYVEYKTAYNGSDAAEAKSITFGSSRVKFNVDKKQLGLSLSATAHTYDHNSRTVNIIGYDYVNGDTNVMSKTVTLDGAAYAVDAYSDSISVKNAGEYEIAFTIVNGNYEFAASFDGTLTYTVDKATATLDETSSSAVFDADSTVQAIPAFAYHLINASLGNRKLTAAELAIGWTIEDFGGNIVTDIKAAGTYTFTFTITGGAEAGNYELQAGLTYTYTIDSAKIKAPTFAASTVYDGKSHAPSEFISDWSTYYGGYKLKFTVSKTDGETVGNKLLGAGKYLIEVMPAASFEWEDDVIADHVTADGVKVLSYEIIVEKLTVVIDWQVTQTVYGSLTVPTVVISNIQTNDSGVSNDVGIVFDRQPVENAGVYEFNVIALSGEDAGNYALPNSGDSTLSGEFTVYKKVVSAPDRESPFTATFDGSAHSVKVFDDYDTELFDTTLSGKYPSEWFDSLGGDVAIADAMSFGNGTLTYRSAGVYTVVFTISDTHKANYCLSEAGKADFENDGDYYSATRTAAEIARKAVPAPSFGNSRAMEYDKYSTAIADGIAAFAASEGLTALNVVYGKRVGGGYDSATSSTQLGGNGQEYIGQYYALLSFTSDGLNYVWGSVQKDDENGYSGEAFIDGGSVYALSYTQDDGARVYLHYAITATQVSLELTVSGYTFGDNGVGYVDENGNDFVANDHIITTDIYSGPSAAKYAFGFTVKSADSGIAINTVAYKFTKDGGEVAASELVNGLPWEAGDYGVSVTVTFTNDAYQPWMSSTTLNVSQRALIIDWKYTDENGTEKVVASKQTATVTYDGEEYEFTPIVKNIPVKISSAETVTRPSLASAKDETELIDAGDHYARVSDVHDGNYDVVEADVKLNIVIKPLKLTVKGVAVASHVYGNSLDGYSDNYTDDHVIFDRDSQSIIAVRIEDGAGNIISSNLGAIVGGTYYVVPYIVTSERGAGNYSLDNTVDGFKASFTVTPRSITVSIDESKATSVYGADGVDLSALCTVDTMPENAVVKNVIALSTESGDVTKTTPVGNYKITCVLVDSVNYTLTFGNYEYEVTPAALIVSGQIDDYVGTYNSVKHNVLPDSQKSKVTAIDGASVSWQYYTGSEWAALDTLDLVNACEATTYRLKASAANHEDKEFTITATVEKATITVTMTMAIFYGEVDNWYDNYKTSLEDFRTDTVHFSLYGFMTKGEADAFHAGELAGFGGSFSYGYADKVYKRGDAAGSTYDLVFVGDDLTADNYVFTGSGTLKVAKLPVTVSLDKPEYTTTYGNPIEPIITATTPAQSMQGGNISLDGLTVYTVTNGALVDGTTNVVGKYEVKISPTDNSAFATVTAPYEITKATNAFIDDGYHLFVGDGTTSVDKASAPSAWVYGDYSANHQDGYNAATGAKHDVNVITLVGAENELTVEVTLALYASRNTVLSVTAPVNDITAALKSAFAAAWQGKKLGAGDYTVRYSMDASDNYVAFEYYEYFKVEKATLTVSPSDVSVVYGEDAKYGVEFEGFVYNGGVLEDIDVAVGDKDAADVLDADNWIIAGYVKGLDVGDYTLTIADTENDFTNNGSYFANYKFAYETGTASVTPRKMLVTVNNATNRYMFIGKYNAVTSDYDKEALADLGVTVRNVPGYYGYYGDEVPFEIRTSARFVQNGKDFTIDVGEYTIYLTFKAGKYSDNYIIEFTDCAISSTAADVNAITFGAENNAGKYTITPAQIIMNVTGPYYKSATGADVLYGRYEGGVYDGREKYYLANPVYGSYDVPNKDSIKFEAMYYRVEGGNSESLGSGVLPKDVGSYRARFFSTGENNNFEEIEDTVTAFDIAYKPVNVGSSALGAVYNGQGQTFTVTFSGLIGDEKLESLGTVSVEIEAAELGENTAADLVHKNLPTAVVTSGNSIIVTATEAATYAVTLMLADSGNYAFAGSQAAFEFTAAYTFTINRAAITVWAQGAEVQYGAQIASGGKPILYDEENGAAAGRFFDGFRAVYGYYTSNNDTRPGSTNSDLAELIADNKENGYFDFTFRANRYNAQRAAGFTCDIDIVDITAVNFDVKRITNGSDTYKATLTVVPRRISLNVMDVTAAELAALTTTVYNNNLAVWTSTHEAELNTRFAAALDKFVTVPTSEVGLLYGDSGDSALSDLDIRLEIGRAVDAGEYPIAVVSDNGNYDVSFLHGGNAYGVTNIVKYTITKATLNVKVHKTTAVEYNDGTETLEVTYGDNMSQETTGNYKVLFSGWLNNDNANLLLNASRSVTFTNGGNQYKPYLSHVGEKYTARVAYYDGEHNDYELKNYVIVCVPSELKVNPRIISVADGCFADKANGVLNSNEYTAEGDYHNGYYGMALPAVVSFDRWQSGVGGTDAANNMPTYKDSYDTKNDTYLGVQYQKAGEAPRRVGDYKVKITLEKNSFDQNDYLFDGNTDWVEYHYSITKRLVTIDWTTAIMDASSLECNYIYAYRSDIMEILSFTFNLQEVVRDNLVITENGLAFTPATSEAGTYQIIIVFNENAAHNYDWNLDQPQAQALIEFRMVGDGKSEIDRDSVSIKCWTYGEDAGTPTAVLLNSNGDAITGVSLRFEYVRVVYDGEVTEGRVISTEEFNGYKLSGSFTFGVPVNAGTYVMRVRFDGNLSYSPANAVYYIFGISKKTINALDNTIYSTYDEDKQNKTVNITATIDGFDTAALTVVSSEARYNVEGDSLVLTADRVSTSGFTLAFKLTSSENYEYDGDVEGGLIIVKWVVKPSDENVVAFNENNAFEYGYGDGYVLEVDTHFVVGNIVEFSYLAFDDANKTTDENGNAMYAPKAGDWLAGLPEHAGRYVVRAFSHSDSDSYNSAYAYSELTVNKATLSVRAEGTAVYGELSGNADVTKFARFTLTDPDGELKLRDTQSAIISEINRNKSVKYTVGGTPSGVWGVKDYALTIEATTADYVIVCEDGCTFTVTKATLTVAIDNGAWSYYGMPFDYSGAKIDVDGLISDDPAERNIYENLIRAKLAADADGDSGFGSYALTVVGFEDDNYVLEVSSGIYHINKLPVTIVMNDGGYYYGEKPVLPHIVGVYHGETKLDDFDASLITVVYIGYDNIPTDAGRYSYSASLVEGCNYELAAPVSGIFEISRVMLDPSLIEFETVYYDGSIKAPTVIGIKDDAFDAEEFDVSYEGEWINAGVAYTIVLTLKNTDNTGWLKVEGAEQRLTYTISRGINKLVASAGGEPTIKIADWTYGQYSTELNAPSAKTAFGADQIVYEYSADGEVWFRDIDTRNAGQYFVRAVVYETTDYETFYSAPVKFNVLPVKLAAPVLNVVTDGAGKNDTYTASELGFEVTGVDFELMNVSYDGSVRLNGNNVTVYATAAGSYVVRVSLKNVNYTWADNVATDGNGNALLEWTVKKQQIALPTHNTDTFIINGSLLEYLPIGFDESLMAIDGNRAAYGGTFTAVVTLVDTDNYEWADGTIEPVTFTWDVVGAHTLFIIVISVLAAVCAALGAVACVLFLRYRNRAKSGVAATGGGTAAQKTANNDSAEDKTDKEVKD